MRIVISFAAAVRIVDRGDLLLILREVALLALLRRRARFRLDSVRRSTDIRPAVRKRILYRQDSRAEIAQLLVDFLDPRRRALTGLIVSLLQRQIVGAALDLFL